MACFIMDILMLTAEAFSYPGGHGWIWQAVWIAPSLTRRQPCTILGYSLVTNTLLDYEDTLVLLYPTIANSLTSYSPIISSNDLVNSRLPCIHSFFNAWLLFKTSFDEIKKLIRI